MRKKAVLFLDIIKKKKKSSGTQGENNEIETKHLNILFLSKVCISILTWFLIYLICRKTGKTGKRYDVMKYACIYIYFIFMFCFVFLLNSARSESSALNIPSAWECIKGHFSVQ